MTVLVIGGSGFLGQALIESLLLNGDCVIATSRSDRRSDRANLTWQTLDLESFSRWPDLLDGVSTVYHLAWSTFPLTAKADPVADARNILGSLRLLEAIKNRPDLRLVFASSGGTVYGLTSGAAVDEHAPTVPMSPHGLSKLAVEHYIGLYADSCLCNPVILRIGNPFGPEQNSKNAFGVIKTFCSAAIDNKQLIIYGDGSVVRDYLYVTDVVNALILAGRKSTTSRVFNIGSGVGHSLNDVIQSIECCLGRILLRRYESARTFDVPISILDVTRAKTELGWMPRVSLKEGIAITLAALQARNGKP